MGEALLILRAYNPKNGPTPQTSRHPGAPDTQAAGPCKEATPPIRDKPTFESSSSGDDGHQSNAQSQCNDCSKNAESHAKATLPLGPPAKRAKHRSASREVASHKPGESLVQAEHSERITPLEETLPGVQCKSASLCHVAPKAPSHQTASQRDQQANLSRPIITQEPPLQTTAAEQLPGRAQQA